MTEKCDHFLNCERSFDKDPRGVEFDDASFVYDEFAGAESSRPVNHNLRRCMLIGCGVVPNVIVVIRNEKLR